MPLQLIVWAERLTPVVQVFEVHWAVHKADFCVYFLQNSSEYTSSDGKTWWSCVLAVCPASFFYHKLALGFML